MATSLGPPNTNAPTHGSRTLTITATVPERSDGDDDIEDNLPPANAVLMLRAEPDSRRRRQRVVWDENVVDNEGCGKKKSKSTLYVCYVLMWC